MVDLDLVSAANNESAFVTCKWLVKNIHKSNLVVLDASVAPIGRNKIEKIDAYIPGSIFFDIEHSFSDKNSPLQHVLLGEEQFELEVRKLGIKKDSLIVIYDRQGIYSSPRAWWNFKIMGHEKVYILNGGLPEWIRFGYKTERSHSTPAVKMHDSKAFSTRLQASKLVDKFELLDSIKNLTNKNKIIDARSQGRFFARDPEPRAGLRGGHIPGSVNIPFTDFIADGKFIGKSKALKKFRDLKCAAEDQLVFSCGSGLTACIDILAAFECGYRNLSLYDGSWTEWASDIQCPVINKNERS